MNKALKSLAIVIASLINLLHGKKIIKMSYITVMFKGGYYTKSWWHQETGKISNKIKSYKLWKYRCSYMCI